MSLLNSISFLLVLREAGRGQVTGGPLFVLLSKILDCCWVGLKSAMESIAERQESNEDNLEFYLLTSLVAQMVKNPPARWETWIQSPGLGRSLGGGHGNPLQYYCLENPHG